MTREEAMERYDEHLKETYTGACVKWHWHSNPQTMYVVSGVMNYEVKPNPAVRLTAGSYLVLGRALHNGTRISKEPCTIFIENPLPNDKHMTDENGNALPPNKSDPR